MTSVDIKGLSIKDGETPQAPTTTTTSTTTSPNLTSFTPPPPGFDTPATTTTTTNSSSTTSATAANNNIKIAKDQEAYRKSPSFNNLAMALGTGLAECMDNSTSDNNNHPTTTNSSTSTTATAAAVAASNNNSNGLDSMDNYARQSRHAVTRLIGHSQFQQQQQEGRGSVPPNYLNGASSSSSAGLGVGNNNGAGAAGMSLNLQYLGGDTTTTGGGGGNVAQQQQQQVRFTAAMMAQQSHIHQGNSGSGPLQDLNIQQQQLQLMGGQQAATNQFLTNNSGGSSGSNSNNNDHHLLQMHQPPPSAGSTTTTGMNTNLPSSSTASAYNPLTKQQALQFQQQSQHPSQNVMMGTTTTTTTPNNNPNIRHSYQGVTVVEPNSARNSPAILNPNENRSSSDPNTPPTADLLKTALGGGGGGGGGVTLQQHPQHPGTTNNNTIAMAMAVGGRASAPPSNLTTGTGRTPSVLHPTHTGAVHHMGHHPNLRAYTANSLQRRVAELHQELGGGGGGVVGGSGNNGVGVVGGPTPPPSRPPTAEPPQQPQQVRHIIVTSATPPLHPNTTAQRVVLSPNPPPTSPSPKHVLLPGGGGGGGAAVVSNTTTTNSRPTTPATAVVVSPEQRERELVAAKELEPFLKRRDGGGGTLDNSTRGSGSNSSSSGNINNSSNNTSSSSSSRGLAILYASTLNIPDVRSTCEAFGALESFRSDFADSKGVVFATFYDLRSAQMAVVELPKALNKMTLSAAAAGGGGGGAWRAVEVEYCVPLNASSATDESMLLLSNLPGSVDEQDLSRMLSSFGEVRAIHYQANMMNGGGDDDEEDDLASYMVEFFDVQDARQALMELEQTNSWGERAGVKVATRSPAKRKQGKELILLMSNWRQGVPMKQPGEVSNAPSSRTPSPPAPVVKQSPPPSTAATADTTQTGGHVHHNMPAGTAAAHSYYQYAPPHQGEIQQQYAAQLVMGPDGHYQYMLVNHGGHYAHPGQMVIDPHQQQQLMYAAVDPQYMHMNPQQYHHVQYANSIPGANYAMPLGHDIQQQQQQQQPPTQFIAMPSNSVGGDVNSSSLSSGCQSPGRGKATRTHSGKSTASISSGSGGSSGNNSGGNADENNDLALFIENVKSGKDVRSSLMVRNIPNKYTQQMLLGEFAAAGHGPDKMDFFYLPIDFKNKCNRGYAFVNFVDYKDIVPFYDEYNGTGWKRFNSDKICDITYARIQGKTAMLKRFENSALMAKDDEYRPMVFVSHGERKGERECFG